MINKTASDTCRLAIKNTVGHNAPGAVYYVLRDGKPFVDASFGDARRADSPDGLLAYGPDTIVHVASVSKFICAVAVLRLIEDWNEIFAHVAMNLADQRIYTGPPRTAIDAQLISRVVKSGTALSLDAGVYNLLSSKLDKDVIAAARSANRNVFPGAGVSSITLRDLLTHTSGLRDNFWDLCGQLGLDGGKLINENAAGGKAIFDLKKVVSVILSQDCAAKVPSYSNDGFNVAGAVVEFLTGVQFEDWCRKKIFPSKAFNDIARRPIDMKRAARYYSTDGKGGFTGGNYHPDYRDFGACGGWYTSASAFCEWVLAVMQSRRFGGIDIIRPVPINRRPLLQGKKLVGIGRPIVNAPERLLDLRLGLDGPLDLGYLRGQAKNGGTGSPGTSTNARFVYLRGYGNYSVVAFTQANGPLDANPLLESGLPSLRRWLYYPAPLRDDGLPEVSSGFDFTGLDQSAYWDENGTEKTVTRGVEFATEVATGDSTGRTNMFGTTPYSAGRSVNSPGFIRLRGFLRGGDGGMTIFRLTSDDGAMLWINDTLLVDNDGAHSPKAIQRNYNLPVQKSVPIMVYWYNISGNGTLFLEWKRPGRAAFEAIPPEQFAQGLLHFKPFTIPLDPKKITPL